MSWTTRARERDGEAKPLRLFIAAEVPDRIKAGLAQAMAPQRGRLSEARWTREDSWHVTLKFLGSTRPRLLSTVEDAVREAAAGAEPFDTALTVMGVFPSPARARVVWAGLADPKERFAGIARALDESLQDYFVPEDRDLTPHLTLARLSPARAIGEFAPDLVGFPVKSKPFTVDHLTLYRSHLSPHGARYEPLLQAPLGG